MQITVKMAAQASRTRLAPSSPPRYTENGPMNISAALNAVPSHEASSTPRCKFPRRSGRPTLINLPVLVAIKAPSSTPNTPMIGCVVMTPRARGGVVEAGGDAELEGDGVLKPGSPPLHPACRKRE